MKNKYEKVYQFKITLDGIKPPIWRRIQVPTAYTFWNLHVAIQDSMGWLDYHLHQFEVDNPSRAVREEIGIPDEDFELEEEVLSGWKLKIANYFSMDNREAKYVYDFGDNWQHTIKLEKILPRNKSVKYPVCIAGERACPPEDCGGIGGYTAFLDKIMNPEDKEYKETLEWAGGNFEPEHFDTEDVRFSDPAKRLKSAY